MSSVKNILILLLFIFAVIMSLLYWHEIESKEKYYKIKDDMLKRKEISLTLREEKVLNKEVCMEELARLKSLNTNANDTLRGISSSKM